MISSVVLSSLLREGGGGGPGTFTPASDEVYLLPGTLGLAGGIGAVPRAADLA